MEECALISFLKNKREEPIEEEKSKKKVGIKNQKTKSLQKEGQSEAASLFLDLLSNPRKSDTIYERKKEMKVDQFDREKDNTNGDKELHRGESRKK